MINEELYTSIANGYNTNTYYEKYRKDRTLQPQEKELLDRVIRELRHRFTRPVTFLDVGCGDGSLYDKYLVQNGCQIYGVDISEKQILKARHNNPYENYMAGNFLDMSPYKSGLKEGAICMYSLFHFIGEDYRKALQLIWSYLDHGGVALINIRNEIRQGIFHKESWCGTPMWWFHPGVDTTIRACREIGFDCEVMPCEFNEEYTYIILRKLKM